MTLRMNVTLSLTAAGFASARRRPPTISGRSFAKDTEASPCVEKFGEIARHRRLRRFSGVPKIAQSRAYGAISVILPENPQHLGLAGGGK
jgi:hypothetical protein